MTVGPTRHCEREQGAKQSHTQNLQCAAKESQRLLRRAYALLAMTGYAMTVTPPTLNAYANQSIKNVHRIFSIHL